MRWLATILRLILPALVAGWLPAAWAMNYSVPYVRHDMPYTLDTLGYGSTVGLLEVNNGANNINIYSNSPEWGLQTFREVQDFSGYAPTTDDSAHGTLVAHILDNMFTYDNQTNVPYAQAWYFSPWSVGMAPRASYYGALFDGNDTKSAFLSLSTSLEYLTATSHVQAINNSWGGDVSQASDLNGMSDISLLMDEYTGYHGKTGGTTSGYRDVLMVMAAGNSGSLLGVPADAYNVLTVGALDTGNHNSNYIDDPTRRPIASVADYSAKKPLADGRCGVDVVAPGTWLAIVENFTVGLDGTNLVLKNISGVLGDGTSFAAPHVTGEAALLYGAPYHPLDTSESMISMSTSTLKGSSFNTDHKLIKALIINSADKIAGLDADGNAQSTWQPGVITVGLDGVTNSIHPLNYAVGSGQANAQEAYYTYYELSNRFWDVNMLTNTGQQICYTYGEGKFTNADFSTPELRLTATLVWDRHVDYTVNTDTNDLTLGTLSTNLLSNLDLILQQETTLGSWVDIYRSISTNDNIEQIFMSNLSATNNYRLEVVATDLADPTTGEQYALVVSYLPIPEPSTVAMTSVLMLAAYARRRWLRHCGPASPDDRESRGQARRKRTVCETWQPQSCAEIKSIVAMRSHRRATAAVHDLYASAPRKQISLAEENRQGQIQRCRA